MRNGWAWLSSSCFDVFQRGCCLGYMHRYHIIGFGGWHYCLGRYRRCDDFFWRNDDTTFVS